MNTMDNPEHVMQFSMDNDLGDIKVDWAKPPSLKDLKRDLEDARTSQYQQTQKIDTWLDNLYVRGSAKPQTKKGRSSVVSRLIRKQAEWRYSALSEPFLSSDKIFEVKPRTWEDVPSATQNSLLLNYQFNNCIDKNSFIDEYVRTAVDEGTVIVKLGWANKEEEVQREVEIFEFIPDPTFTQTLQEVAQLKENNPNGYHRLPDELKTALDISLKTEVAHRPSPTGEFETITETKIIQNHPTVEVCNYKNSYIDPTCQGDLAKAGFFVYTFSSDKSELQKDGRYSNLDKISTDNNNLNSDPDYDPTDDENNNFNFNDEPRKKFIVNEYWGFMDVNGDGTTTPIVAAWVGNTLIRLEENPFSDKELPIVTVPYLPVRKSIYGEPDGALLEENQKIKGAVLRGMIDSMGRSANGQTAIRKDMLDATNRRRYERGDDYEFNIQVDPRQGIYQHQFPELPSSTQYMLQLQDMEAESLTGVKAFSGGLSGDQLGDVATAVKGVLDSASKRELGILRRLSSGMIKIGKKFMSMNAEFLSEEEVIRVTNDDFVNIRRDELAGQFDLILSISTAEEENAKAQELAFMLQTMGNNIDFSITKMILSKLFTLRKLPDLAEAIQNFEPQPDPLEQAIKEAELAKIQAEIQKIQSETVENQSEVNLDQAKAQKELAQANKLNSEADRQALDFVETEQGVTQERELEKAKAQAQGNMELEAFKYNLDERRASQNKTAEIESKLLDRYLEQTK